MEELKRENEELRKKIVEKLRTRFDKADTIGIMLGVNRLIGNELEQEKLCNQ